MLSPVNFGACTDKGTGQIVTSDLKAPPGSSVVSPLSTLVVGLQALSSSSVDSAERRIQSLLNINQAIDLTSFDIINAVSRSTGRRVLLQSTTSTWSSKLLECGTIGKIVMCFYTQTVKSICRAGAKQAFSIMCQVVSTVSQISAVLYGADTANDPDEPDLWQQDDGRLSMAETVYTSVAAFGKGDADGQVLQIDLSSKVRTRSSWHGLSRYHMKSCKL